MLEPRVGLPLLKYSLSIRGVQSSRTKTLKVLRRICASRDNSAACESKMRNTDHRRGVFLLECMVMIMLLCPYRPIGGPLVIHTQGVI